MSDSQFSDNSQFDWWNQLLIKIIQCSWCFITCLLRKVDSPVLARFMVNHSRLCSMIVSRATNKFKIELNYMCNRSLIKSVHKHYIFFICSYYKKFYNRTKQLMLHFLCWNIRFVIIQMFFIVYVYQLRNFLKPKLVNRFLSRFVFM